MTTIYDVAKEVGCAPSTVSKYITKHGYVSKKMAAKIDRAMVKLDYHYNGLARNLSTHTNNRIGIMVPFLDHPYFQKLVNAITVEASKLNKEVVILPTAYDPQKEKEYLQELEHNLLNSLIISSHALSADYIAKYHRFGQIVFCEESKVVGTQYVSNNRWDIYCQLFQKLKADGQKCAGLLLIRQPSHSKTSRQLFSAYQTVFGEQPQLVVYNCRTTEDGRLAYHRLINRNANLQVLLAESDISATGAYLESQKQGKAITTIGQGNQLVSKILGFTSIDQRLTDIGKQAVHLACGLSKNNECVKFKIIWR